MIPKTFTLVNREWVVRFVTTKQLQKHLDHHYGDDPGGAKETLGLCNPQVARIFINKDLHECTDQMEHTFWHEFVHAYKYANGEVNHDEVEVDRIGAYLHQFEKTKQGECNGTKGKTT